ncbi:MAG: carbon storage regulator [Candidatus Scalindua sp.]|jgi:carbon storage regulator CsrA|nr:carbon storage regulator [Candidatus Scalindua sp.]
MLVLTRREGQSLLIGNDIRVTVLIIFEKRIKLQIKDLGNNIITCRLGAITPIRGDITVKVVDIDQKQVKLGIEAPKDMKVDREEANKEEI